VAGRDITEGDGNVWALAPDGLPIARGTADIGIVSTDAIWQNTNISYDFAIGGMPFISAVTDKNEYLRETAPFKKDQFDNGQEPGEQSLTGWWLRSQMSFHGGAGINFYDPLTNDESGHYRFFDSKGVDVWTKGQVTMLHSVSDAHTTTGPVVGTDHQHSNQHVRTIQWGGVNGVLLHDEYDVDKIYPAITVSITNKALTSNVATLTTSAAHGLTIGMTITISGVDATFNGEYRITGVPTTTTFTYAKTASNVTSAAVSPVGTGVTNPVIHFIDYISGTDRKVFAICDDGVNAYWVTNKTSGGNQRLTMFKKPLSGDSITGSSNPSATGDVTQMFQSGDEEIIYAAMEFIKDRIILCVNNKVYEFPTSTDAIGDGTLVYTNPNTNYHYTSVAASGPAIYTAGHSGIYSTIQKYTLTTSGGMPVLTSAVVAAELPAGEIVEKIFYYLGYMVIGTSKGVRVALVNDQDGSLTYGPLIMETEQPVYDFAARDHFVWCASGIGSINAGLIRIDLSNEIETLRFAYANDLEQAQTTEHYTTGVNFLGTTNRLAFTTAYNATNGAIYLESENELVEDGYLTTGNIRFGTLEPKNFKRLVGRGDFTKGTFTLISVDANNTEYEHVTYDSVVPSVEIGTNQPTSAVEYLAYKFVFRRDTTTTSTGPIFKGYQAKATIATPRQRIIQFPVYNFDVETDRNGVQVGYEDRAHNRLLQLEEIEQSGDIILWQDLNTQELRQAQIEKIRFTKATPPSGRFSGSGGIMEIVVRTV
jgi:hypothetical protein